MLIELAVRDLGVIESARLLLSPGLTALTGETGAGKTMVVEAISLLLGARAEPALVRAGAHEAVVEGRFLDGEDEVVLTRVVPRDGRSRAYVDGRMATATALAERGAALVDLLGQHAHQSLLSQAAQRAALDAAAGIDLQPLAEARAHLEEVEAQMAAIGGDPGARAREVDLLRYQLDEIDEAGIDGPEEDLRLTAEEDLLADAVAHREAAERALAALGDEGGARDRAATALAAVDGRAPFAELGTRLAGAVADLEDLVAEVRSAAESIVDDPERLAEIRERRHRLVELVRKYGSARAGAMGDGDLAEVLAYAGETRSRLAELESHDARSAALDEERRRALEGLAAAAAAVGAARRAAAPGLAQAITSHLRDLALPSAQVEVRVGADDPGDAVEVLLAANPGSPALPIAKAASGGELARVGLALRMVLTADQPCLVFDEVDAGIGGEAAVAVGRSLAEVATDRQVLVVTHLPQVAAFASAQVVVRKRSDGRTTTADVEVLDGEARVAELARMLAGRTDSARARAHAEELLAEAEDLFAR